MPWDDLIKVANKAEARAKTQGSTHLNQRCPKGKRPLKMSLNSRDNQLEKAQQKTDSVSQEQVPDKANQAEQRHETSKKTRKNKKQKSHQAKQDQRKDNTPASGTNITPTKKKTGQNWDISEITYYNCNKKSHYASDCTEPKTKK